MNKALIFKLLFLSLFATSLISAKSFATTEACDEISDREFIRFFDNTNTWIRVKPGTFEIYSLNIRYELIIDFNNRAQSYIRAFGFTKDGLGLICKTEDSNKLDFYTLSKETQITVQKNREGLSTTYLGKRYYFAPQDKIKYE